MSLRERKPEPYSRADAEAMVDQWLPDIPSWQREIVIRVLTGERLTLVPPGRRL